MKPHHLTIRPGELAWTQSPTAHALVPVLVVALNRRRALVELETGERDIERVRWTVPRARLARDVAELYAHRTPATPPARSPRPTQRPPRERP